MENILIIPAGKSKLSLFLRIYLSDNPDDPLGGVALPIITALDGSTGTEIACPDQAEFSVTMEDILDNGGFDPTGLVPNSANVPKRRTQGSPLHLENCAS